MTRVAASDAICTTAPSSGSSRSRFMSVLRRRCCPPESELRATLSRVGGALDEVLDGLRELSRPIHLAVL